MAYSITSPTRSVTPVVTVGGIALQNIVSASVNFSLDSPVPTADVTVAGKLPEWVQRDMSVTIDFAGRLFTGVVKRRQRSPGQSTIQCVGKTQKLWQPFKVSGWVFTNVSAKSAVEQILNDVGVTDRSIDMVDWTIGVVQDAIIDVTTPGDAVQKIIDVDGHRMFETPSGGLVIRQLLGVPASTPARTYTTTGTPPWVNDISDDEDPDQVKKEVIVTGAAIGSQDAEGNAGQTQIQSPPVFTTSNELVEGPHELYSMNYQNDLIETVEKATSVALRLLDKYHRIIEQISMTVPLDPDIRLAMTIGVQDAAVTGRSVNWFVDGYTHTFANGQCETTLELIGGDQSGTSGKVAPIADFTYSVERELIGTEMRTLVSCHSVSVDLDGTIANYRWTDNYNPPNAREGATLTDITFVYNPAVMTTVDITLTVTDNDGFKSSITKTIYLGPGAMENQFVPTIAAACWSGSGAAMFTPDGGFTWKDQSVPTGGGNFISVAAAEYGGPDDKGVILLGSNNGRIFRSTDQLATAPTLVFTEPAGSPINHIWWDINVQNRVWACTQNGRLYWSVGGSTWELYHDFGGTYPLTRIATPKGPPVVFVFGGRADRPDTLIQWNWQDNSTIWHRPDMSAFTPSAAGDHIAEAAANVFPELCIMFRGTREPAIMYTANLYASPVVWQNATGLAAGLRDGRFVCPQGAAVGEEGGTAGTFLAAFDTKEMWTTANGVEWRRTVTQLPSPGTPSLSAVSGSLPPGTYGYRVTATNDYGETLPSPGATITITTTRGIRVTWAAVPGATGYKVYGRTPGSELFMASVVTTEWTDTGAVTPSGAMPTVNSTSWVLPGTAANKPWHAMNVRRHPTLFFGASLEGLWKTTDGGVKVGFIRPAAGISTWPSGASGRMISFVAQASEVSLEPDEVSVIFWDGADDKFKLVSLEGTSWAIKNANLPDSPRRLRRFGNTMFHCVGGYRHWGPLRRSTDGGVTWTSVLDRCSAIARAADGSYWAVAHSAANCIHGWPAAWYAYRSTDDGLTWAFVADISIRPGESRNSPLTSIDCDPLNPARVVVVGRRHTAGPDTVYTLDGGATWTRRSPGGPTATGGEELLWCIWGSNNRLIRASGLFPQGIQVSDDFGVTWVSKYVRLGPAIWEVKHLVRAGFWIYAPATEDDETSLVRSNDNGESWEAVGKPPEFDWVLGAAYQPNGNRLYVVAMEVGIANDVYRLQPATAPSGELTYTALTYNLGRVIGSASNPRVQGVAVKT